MTVFVKLNFSRHWIMVYRLWLRTKRNTTLRLSLSLSLDRLFPRATGRRLPWIRHGDESVYIYTYPIYIYIYIYLYIIRIRIYNIYVHSNGWIASVRTGLYARLLFFPRLIVLLLEYLYTQRIFLTPFLRFYRRIRKISRKLTTIFHESLKLDWNSHIVRVRV